VKYLASIITLFHLFFPSATKTNPITTLVSPISSAHIVCIDPGHGGEDPGASNGDLNEADVNLDIAQKLKSLLVQSGYRVVLTRVDSRTDLQNSDRAKICNDNHAQVLVAIHLNSNWDTTLDYTQALYGTEEKDKKFADLMDQTLSQDLSVSDGDTTDFEDNLLLKANMPATLLETVFLTNSDEYTQLTDGTGKRQQQIALALYDGLNKWFSQTAPK
jgi:N-acetylmuramoyl-L-alanine amidase